MQTLVIYDIRDDRLRNRIAEACKDYGLLRVQWSAFLGDLNHNRRQELEQRLRRALGRKPGNIQLYPLCEHDAGLRVEIAGAAAPGAGGSGDEDGGSESRAERGRGPGRTGGGRGRGGRAGAGEGAARRAGGGGPRRRR
ncbi:MAG: CRISPR-associated endonuclease Cas2 [Acetobacteraceae bacterium]|nr:CRISPR-associated endonuclease Cas2 [Acetobacteraceae bacterium]